MNFDERIDRQIDAAFKSYKKQKLLVGLIDQFILSCKGGKRIRGRLVKLGFEIATGKTSPKIFNPAAAVEIFHSSILAHDDIIDQSELRRGKPSLYKSSSIPQAIILADLGFFLANKLIAGSNFENGRKNQALALFNQMSINTGLGELLDIDSGPKDQEQIIEVSYLKTASYTFIGPLSLGIILGGKDKLLKVIERFGRNLGIAYQIQDDILGIFGSNTGKSIKSDIEEGKKTLLWWYAVENGGKSDRQTLSKFYGKGKISKIEADKVREVFTKTGAFDYCKQKSLDYMALAKKSIPEITRDKKLIKKIEEMTEYLIGRSK